MGHASLRSLRLPAHPASTKGQGNYQTTVFVYASLVSTRQQG